MVDNILENVKELVLDKFSKNGQQKEPINVIADAGYISGSNLEQIEKEEYKGKIEPYIPDTSDRNKYRECDKVDNKDLPFHRTKFIYNKEENSFTCRSGKKLFYTGKCISHGVCYHIYENHTECLICPHYEKCKNNKNGRRIFISEYQALIDKMRSKLSTSEGKKIYSIRKITVEPVFGNLSQNLGFREFLLRTKQKVRGEFSLMCTAHNILKIAKFIKQSGTTLREAMNMSKLSVALDTS